MKKITAHIKTGTGLVAQTLEMPDGTDPCEFAEFKMIEFQSFGRGKVLIRVADVAFWTYD